MNILTEWAARWGIPAQALSDLTMRLLSADVAPPAEASLSEAGVQSRVRLAASRQGMRLWRNNVGAFHDAERDVHVRFGLANDSAAMNRSIKSGDLIGIAPRLIQPADVGSLIGQFVSIECKHAAWRWAGTDREVAQQNWALLVQSLGGRAQFATSEAAL